MRYDIVPRSGLLYIINRLRTPKRLYRSGFYFGYMRYMFLACNCVPARRAGSKYTSLIHIPNTHPFHRLIMEFLEFLMLTAAMLLILFKPEKEKLAWWLLIVSWAVVVLMYVGHVSNAILGVLNI